MDSGALRVTLRLLEPQDADVIAGWGEDPQFCREADWSTRMASADRRRFQQSLIEAPPPELIRWGAVVESVLVGYVDLQGAEPDRRELGFVIGERDRWGSGLGGLAAAAGLDHGFGRLGLRHVWAEALEANLRSVHVLQSLGMVETGLGDHGRFLDQPCRYRRFSISVEEWARQRAH